LRVINRLTAVLPRLLADKQERTVAVFHTDVDERLQTVAASNLDTAKITASWMPLSWLQSFSMQNLLRYGINYPADITANYEYQLTSIEQFFIAVPCALNIAEDLLQTAYNTVIRYIYSEFVVIISILSGLEYYMQISIAVFIVVTETLRYYYNLA